MMMGCGCRSVSEALRVLGRGVLDELVYGMRGGKRVRILVIRSGVSEATGSWDWMRLWAVR